jgi:hypothetical protein
MLIYEKGMCKHLMKNGNQCPTKPRHGCDYCGKHQYHVQTDMNQNSISPTKRGRPSIRTSEERQEQQRQASLKYYHANREDAIKRVMKYQKDNKETYSFNSRVKYYMKKYPEKYKTIDDAREYVKNTDTLKNK